MKRPLRMTKVRWALAIAMWLLLVSCPFLCSNSKQQKLPAVRVDKVARANVASFVSGPATVEPRVKVEISANVMGKVTRIYVQEGQRVKKGDLLLELEQTQYLAGRDEAGAAYRSAVRSSELARAKWETAGEVFKRKQELYNKKLISAEQYDLARTEYDAQRTEYELARDNVVRARAALAQAKDSLAKTVYAAPLDGVVTDLNVEEGEFTVVGTLNTPGTVMVTVADLAAMEVTADIDETDVVHVRLGQPASVTVDAFPDTVFKGEVIEIASSAKESPLAVATTEEKTSADFEVKVLLGGDTSALRPGMSATADVVTDEAKGVVAVPIQALVTRTRDKVAEWETARAGKRVKKKAPAATESDELARADYVKGVFLWEEKTALVKRARFVPVTTGIAGERLIEIKSGLKGGEEIIVGPYKTLRELNDGDAVRKENPKKAAGAAKEKAS